MSLEREAARRTGRSAADPGAPYKAGDRSARRSPAQSRDDERDDRQESFSAWRRANQDFLDELDLYETECARSTRLSNDFLESIIRVIKRRSVPSRKQMDVARECLEELHADLAWLSKDPEACPSSFDEDVWQLARTFRDEAESRDVELRTHLPAMYHLINGRLARTKLRSRENWVDLMQKMIIEFWDDQVIIAQQDRAIDQFTGVETFKGLAQWALRMEANARAEWRIEDGRRPHSPGREKRVARARRRQAARERLDALDLEDPAAVSAFRAEARARREAMMKELSE